MTHEHETTLMDEQFERRSAFFREQEAMMQNIREIGFARYAQDLTELADAFRLKDRCMRCIDEGTPGGIHSAGSGILREKSEVLAAFRAAKVDRITSHDGCGAAVLYTKTHGFDPGRADDYGKAWAQEIAEELSLPYEHIDFSAMQRPKDFHIARVAYYDGTGRFDFSNVAGLPAGFTISKKIQREADSLTEAQVASNIALGDHGFGELISPASPFMIVAIGESKKELTALQAELAKAELPQDGRVAIDGFVAPRVK